MSTPVIEAIDNVNQASLETVFAAVAADPTARDNLSQSDQNIDKVSTNVGLIEELNANEEAIRKMLCRREGRDPANFADLDAVAADQGLMQAIAARQESSKVLARSQKASAAASASQTAMQEVGASQIAIQEVGASQTAMTEIDQVDFAVRAIMCGTTTLDPTDFANAEDIAQNASAMSEIVGNDTTRNTLAASQTAMQEVAASQVAMQEVVASQPTMQEVADSQVAIQEVAASQTAMQEVASSQTAMQEVAASQTAVDAIGSNANENITANTVLNSSTATQEFSAAPLVQRFERNFVDSRGAGGNITTSRVLVTSNNTSGDGGAGIDFTNDVGPQTEEGSTFIINSANANDGNNQASGSVGFNGIVIN